MQIYNVVLVVLTQLLLVEGNRFRIRTDKLTDCDYKGYIPGGKVTDVGSIDAPIATIAKKGIASVLGKTAQASTLAMHSMNAIKAITGAFEKIAPTLGPLLGVFGAVTGIFKSLTEIKPKDILNAANTAMGTLTKDINDKLERMQGYVDSQIITVEKNLIQREYQVGFNLWIACVEEASIELSNECQREAYATLSANRPKFAVFVSKLTSNVALTGFEAREVEAYLVAFRDYANLVLMTLKPLVQTYANDHSTEGRNHYNRYKNAIKAQADFFERYARLAVNAILQAHRGTYHDSGVCSGTVSCGPLKKVTDNTIWKKHVANSVRCTCVIEDGTKQLCQIDFFMRLDDYVGAGYNDYVYPNCNTNTAGAREYSGRLLVAEARNYQRKNLAVAAAYWQKELLDFIPVWQTVSEIVTPAGRRDEVADVFADVPAPQFKFSKRHAARLAKAESKARKKKSE